MNAFKSLRTGRERQIEAVGVIKLLIEKGARCEITQKDGERALRERGVPLLLSCVSPLLLACQIGGPEFARLLVEKAGADPNRKGKCSDSPDEREQLPLEVALSHSTPDEGFWDPGTARGLLVMTLIELGARLDLLMESGDPDCLRLVNRWLSDTIMNYDCHGSLLEKIIISLRPSVLDMGTTCDPSVCPHSDRIRTPIGAALATKYTRGVRVLVEAGANVNTSLCSKCVTRFTDEQEAPLGLMSREAPLLLALATGQWEAAEVWVRAGADTRVVWERWGFGNLPSCLRECPASLLALMRPDFILSEGTGQSG